MCGIAGYSGRAPLGRDRIEHCLELMHHRGPDAAGDASFETSGGRHTHLLSTRLDIIDLDERSNQPFRYGPLTLSYNGELYNYLEVRAGLERAGASFRTTGDTEVMAATLLQGGHDALDACEGMWAFALYDERDGSVLLSRDRFGEKPLFVHRSGDALYWGSEPKFIFALASARFVPDLDQLRRYIVNGYRSLHKHGATFFEGVEEVLPGTSLSVDASGDVEQLTYWQRSAPPPQDLSYEESVTLTREHVIRALELRLRADVPLAFCMSGGVDSVSLISIAKRIFGYDVHGFTILNEDERYEEAELVAETVAALELRHSPVTLDTTGGLDLLRTLVRQHDGPIGTISYVAHWLLMEGIAREGYKVSVSGTGADELFSGYWDHHLAYLHDVRDDEESYKAARAAWEAHVKPHVRNPYLTDADLFVANPSERRHLYLNAETFAGYLTQPWSESFVETRHHEDLLRSRMLNELFTEAVPVILHEDDLNAMAFSIENRSPYLDRSLFDAAARIPTSHLVRDGRAKAVLRDAMRGIVPDAVLDSRRKVGFNAPVEAVLDTQDAEVRDRILEPGPLHELVRADRLAELLARDRLPNSESKLLFNIVNAKLFLEEQA